MSAGAQAPTEQSGGLEKGHRILDLVPDKDINQNLEAKCVPARGFSRGSSFANSVG